MTLAAPTVAPTFHAAGISWAPAGGGASTVAFVRYRKQGTTPWTDSLPLWWDHRASIGPTAGSPDNNIPLHYMGSIGGHRSLRPNTTYELELSLSSGDLNVSTFTTLDEDTLINPALTVNLDCFVGGVDRSTQYTTLGGGAAGTGYKLIQPLDPAHNVINLDPSGSGSTTIDYGIACNHSYVVLRGFHIKNPEMNGINLGTGINHVIIEGCTIEGFGRILTTTSSGAAAGTTDIPCGSTAGFVSSDGTAKVGSAWVHYTSISANTLTGCSSHALVPAGTTVTQGADADCGIGQNLGAGGITFLIVQGCVIRNPRSTSNPWNEPNGGAVIGHPVGPHGIKVAATLISNNIFRYNEIYCDNGHFFNDGIAGTGNLTANGFPGDNSDIYGNWVTQCLDDAIEVEGGNGNVRVWGNFTGESFTGIATAPSQRGPVYVTHNIIGGPAHADDGSGDSDLAGRGPAFKLGKHASLREDGRRYFFHNTMLQPTAGETYPLGHGRGPEDSGGPAQNIYSRNNIYQGYRPSPQQSIDCIGLNNDFDYDMCNGAVAVTGTVGTHMVTAAPTFKTGPPAHGNNAGTSGLYQLALGSPGQGAGIEIPGFSDGPNPDIGACSQDKLSMVFGLDAAGLVPVGELNQDDEIDGTPVGLVNGNTVVRGVPFGQLTNTDEV